MTLAANRIVAGEGRAVWHLAEPAVMLPGMVALAVGLALGLPLALPWLRLAGAALGLAGLVWLVSQGAP
ncbi:MAG: ABC transporter permease, partial [Hyphomicrobiales bacterium]